NEARKHRMAIKIAECMGGDIQGKTIAILGLTFKANTEDMRDSPSLVIIPELLKRGAILRAYDPQGMHEARQVVKENIIWCKDEYDASGDADAVVVLTEWGQFAALDFEHLARLVGVPLLIDLRGILPEEKVKEAGFRYVTVGKKEEA